MFNSAFLITILLVVFAGIIFSVVKSSPTSTIVLPAEHISISPIYTNRTTAQSNLLIYDIVRVALPANEISLPAGFEDLHIRILNTTLIDLTVKEVGGSIVVTMNNELVSFKYQSGAWVVYTSY